MKILKSYVNAGSSFYLISNAINMALEMESPKDISIRYFGEIRKNNVMDRIKMLYPNQDVISQINFEVVSNHVPCTLDSIIENSMKWNHNDIIIIDVRVRTHMPSNAFDEAKTINYTLDILSKVRDVDLIKKEQMNRIDNHTKGKCNYVEHNDFRWEMSIDENGTDLLYSVLFLKDGDSE